MFTDTRVPLTLERVRELELPTGPLEFTQTWLQAGKGKLHTPSTYENHAGRPDCGREVKSGYKLVELPFVGEGAPVRHETCSYCHWRGDANERTPAPALPWLHAVERLAGTVVALEEAEKHADVAEYDDLLTWKKNPPRRHHNDETFAEHPELAAAIDAKWAQIEARYETLIAKVDARLDADNQATLPAELDALVIPLACRRAHDYEYLKSFWGLYRISEPQNRYSNGNYGPESAWQQVVDVWSTLVAGDGDPDVTDPAAAAAEAVSSYFGTEVIHLRLLTELGPIQLSGTHFAGPQEWANAELELHHRAAAVDWIELLNQALAEVLALRADPEPRLLVTTEWDDSNNPTGIYAALLARFPVLATGLIEHDQPAVRREDRFAVLEVPAIVGTYVDEGSLSKVYDFAPANDRSRAALADEATLRRLGRALSQWNDKPVRLIGERISAEPEVVPVLDGWTLRPWTDADYDAYDAIVCEPSIGEYLGEIEGGPPTSDVVLERLDTSLHMRCAIVRADNPAEPLGLVSGGSLGDTFDVSFGVIESAQRQGAGRAVVRIINRMVRDVRPGLTVTGVIRKDNEACLGLMASLGINVDTQYDDDAEDYLRV